MTAIDASSGSSAAPHASAPGRVALEARGIRRTYGAMVALEGLSFAARAGEVVGVLGPNGAGKTTAIRVLTTILPPSAGSFEVAGVPHTRPSEIRRRIGVLPESAGYPEQQTGFEFLRYHAQLFGLSRTAAGTAASALLDEVGLAERGSSPIGAYSRGMRQRLGIARALVNEPAVAFFDEPTLGLDPTGQRHVLRLVQDIARTRGTSVILSTHVLAEVEEICSRVLILGNGRLLAEGTVEEVTRRAAAPRRARFRVPGQARDRALIALGALGDVQPADGRADWVVATLAGTDATREAAQRQIHDAIGALAREGIPLLAFELEGARLSDAFLALTEDG